MAQVTDLRQMGVNWLEKETIHGKSFLNIYYLLKVSNSLLGLKSIVSTENITNLMALYFGLDGSYYEDIGKRFEKRFPDEYTKLVAELNKLK